MKHHVSLLLATIMILACQNVSIKPDSSGQTDDMKKMQDTTPRVTGIGGIFFTTKNPQETRNWYRRNLGLAVNEYGSPFEFRNAHNPDEINYLQWSPFENGTNYFSPSTKEFMINYRVNDLDGLLKKLKQNGVIIVDSISVYEYGRFIHIMDNDGNKIELWEPKDSYFTQLAEKTTK